MRRTQPRLHRLLRALLACWALLLVFEPPVAASAAGELRTLSAWLLPGGARPAAPPSYRAGLSSPGRAAAPASGRATGVRASRACAQRVAAQRVAAQRAVARGVVAHGASALGVSALTALSVQARRAPGVDETRSPRLDGRYLYLEVQSLLC